MRTRRRFSAEFKAKVVLEAITPHGFPSPEPDRSVVPMPRVRPPRLILIDAPLTQVVAWAILAHRSGPTAPGDGSMVGTVLLQYFLQSFAKHCRAERLFDPWVESLLEERGCIWGEGAASHEDHPAGLIG